MKPEVTPDPEKEFLRVHEAVNMSGIPRTTLYRHISDGSLPSKCLRAKGALRGIRLIPRQALRDFINGLEDGATKQGRAES